MGAQLQILFLIFISLSLTKTEGSSCQDAMQRCEADGGCRWHVAELSVRCRSDTCKRQECSMALQRFASYVPRPLSEPLMFCHCSSHDDQCLLQQSLFYPKCLYMSAESPRTCSQLVTECSQDVRCNQLRTSIASVCPVTKAICATDNLDHCRQTLLYSRGSLLESPCFCAISDIECLKHQSAMIPNNPCIEKAMMDYSKLMGYMAPSNRFYNMETNRVIADENNRQQKQQVNPPRDSKNQVLRTNEAHQQLELKPTKATMNKNDRIGTKDKTMNEGGKEEREEMAVQRPPTQHPHRKSPKTTPSLDISEEIYVTKADTQLESTNIEWMKEKERLWKQEDEQPMKEEKRSDEWDEDRQKEREKQRVRTQQRIQQMRKAEEMRNKEKMQAGAQEETQKEEEVENSMDRFVKEKGKQKGGKDKRLQGKETGDGRVDDEEMVVRDAEKLQKAIVRQKSQRSTTAAPVFMQLTSSEIPPWVSTTLTTEPKTTEYITIAPPVSEDKCSIKDANGKELEFNQNSIIRRNLDWAGRCSSWCECIDVEKLSCERLPCHADIPCEAPLTNMDFGERLYLQGRGACMCESGVFVCDTPEQMPDLQPGLYILAGYSLADLEMLRKEIPQEVLERAGFLSSDVGKDIASQLQWALERRLPEDLKCRIVMLEKHSDEGNAFYQVEWFGQNVFLNDTRQIWRSDGMEKMCSPYVRHLVEGFALNESPRFQLILSSVRQLRLVDMLDGLPPVNHSINPTFNVLLFFFFSILHFEYLSHQT